MDIPSFLIQQVQEKKVVIFLGAGASIEAKDDAGKTPPSSEMLAGLLADRFLGGKFKDLPLHQVGEYAISEADLPTVQNYIREIFEGFKPTRAHKLLCKFVWKGIATTNYDRLVELAYENSQNALQTPQPFIENGDRVEDRLRSPQAVMLLKLHGCITRVSNPDCPLILTTDQYIDHKKGRVRIFDHLKSWAYECPIVFVGHSLQDQDIRTILRECVDLQENRPRYYLVLPTLDEIEVRFWEHRRVSAIKGKFEDFLLHLDDSIPSPFRGIAVLKKDTEFPIFDRFKSRDSLSTACKQFLETDVEYLPALSAMSSISPANFYKGFNPGWSAIEQNLDFPRHLADTIIADNFLIQEADHRQDIELILIKAHAGSGKTVLLRRISWDAARDYNKICLFIKPHGAINTLAIQELVNRCQERIFLFVDDAADRTRELEVLVKTIGPEGKHLTVITAERINEWNTSCSSLSPYVHSDYELRYLSLREIDLLLGLLERHRALGTLATSNIEERRLAFKEHAGRQLLVALHEATLGKPFEDIIEDEYRNIKPIEAQRMYLTICTLNRLNVPVRAGIISRIHGIGFEEFKNKFFSPLEHIIHANFNPLIRDFMYEARHPRIAEIVFERILNDSEERYDTYIKCLNELNIDYSSDRLAFRQMVKGRTVMELFPKHELAKGIFEKAKRIAGEDSYFFHQNALYEMHRDSGDLDYAAELLTKASQLGYGSQLAPIDHSMAEIFLRRAERGRTPIEIEKFLTQAAIKARKLKTAYPTEGYAYHTLVKVDLKRLKLIIEQSNGEPPSETVRLIVKDIEQNLFEGNQLVPDPGGYLLDAEAQLAIILRDSKRVLESLQQAFNINPRNGYVGIRLARFYYSQEKIPEAKEILEKALDANPNDRKLHYEYSRLLIETDSGSPDQLIYHLKRAFSEGDKKL